MVGVLEPSVPYPADTEITRTLRKPASSRRHHGHLPHPSHDRAVRPAGAGSVGGRGPRRADRGARRDVREHPDATRAARIGLTVTPLRDQITVRRGPSSRAAGGRGFGLLIAVSTRPPDCVARRAARRELAVRAALGASRVSPAKRCWPKAWFSAAPARRGSGAGAPAGGSGARYVSRFSVRRSTYRRCHTALGGAALRSPRRSRSRTSHACLRQCARWPVLRAVRPDHPGHNPPVVGHSNRADRVLLRAAGGRGALLATLLTLRTSDPGYETRQVLAFDIPSASIGIRDAREMAFYQEVAKRVGDLPGVTEAALGSFVPWRDAGSFPSFPFAVEGHSPPAGEDRPYARLRVVAPRFFSVLGVPLIDGRDFTDRMRGQRAGGDREQSVARRVFRTATPSTEAVVDRRALRQSPSAPHHCRRRGPRRRERPASELALTIYHPVQQVRTAGRLFVHASGDPYALIPAITRTIPADVARAAGRACRHARDVRADLLAPQRPNALVVPVSPAVALLIAVVGVWGGLASASARGHGS